MLCDKLFPLLLQKWDKIPKHPLRTSIGHRMTLVWTCPTITLPTNIMYTGLQRQLILIVLLNYLYDGRTLRISNGHGMTLVDISLNLPLHQSSNQHHTLDRRRHSDRLILLVFIELFVWREDDRRDDTVQGLPLLLRPEKQGLSNGVNCLLYQNISNFAWFSNSPLFVVPDMCCAEWW